MHESEQTGQKQCLNFGRKDSLMRACAHICLCLRECVLEQSRLHSWGGADQHEWHLCDGVYLLKRPQ